MVLIEEEKVKLINNTTTYLWANMPNKVLYTNKDLSKIFNCSVKTISRKRKEYKIEVLTMSSRLAWTKENVNDLINSWIPQSINEA